MPRGRDELAHGRRVAVGSGDHAQDEALVARVEDPSEHHGEAALEVAPPALGHEPVSCRAVSPVETGRVVERDRVAVLGDAVVGLAQALHVPAGQRERLHVDHGLVADVDVVHARGPVDGQPVLAGAHDGDDPAVVVGEAAERRPDLLPLGERPDGVGRDQADAAVDGVGDERVAVEEPLLVAAQGEVVEGALAVAAARCRGPAPPPRARPSGGGRPRGRVARSTATTASVDADGEEARGRGSRRGGRGAATVRMPTRRSATACPLLPQVWWGRLRSKRRVSSRPRS